MALFMDVHHARSLPRKARPELHDDHGFGRGFVGGESSSRMINMQIRTLLPHQPR